MPDEDKLKLQRSAEADENVQVRLQSRLILKLNVTIAGEFANIQNTLTQRDIMILPDTTMKEAVKRMYDAVVVPGGKGHMYVAQNKMCVKSLKKHFTKKRLVVLMSDAPRILLVNRMALGKQITCHRSVRDEMLKDYKYVEAQKIIIDGNLITTPGEAFAIDCALLIVATLVDEQEAVYIARKIRYTS